MLKTCDIINSNLVSSEIKCTAAKNHKILTRTTKPNISNKKITQDLLENTSNGNRVLYICILQATDQRRNSAHKNMSRISHMIERRLCTH